PRPHPQLLERLVQGDPFGGGHHPLGLLDPDRLASACRSWGTSSWWLANSTAVRTSSAVTTANAPRAWTSAGVHAPGWVAYTFRVPTGWSASRTGTLSPPAPATAGPRPRS